MGDRKIRKAAITARSWLEIDLTYGDADRRQKAYEAREEEGKNELKKLGEHEKVWTSRW
jgi:hypothetical protein